MADIWSGIGAEIATSEGEWLYRMGQEIRGPLPETALANKIATGQVPLSILVAREGGDFHPVTRVATFAEPVELAQKQLARTRARRIGLIVAVGTVILLAGGGAAGYMIWKEVEEQRLQALRDAEAEAAALEAQRAQLEAKTEGPELVALVSFGTEDEVEIKQTGRKPKRPKRPRPGGKTPPPEPEESFGSCQRSQGQILSVLQKHLATINVCVEDEKTRDAGRLPSQLKLDFVVQTTGAITDFRILDRHYRTGPMNNCMIKVFRRIKYPSVGGSNCPITIPINIGN